ncbi:Replicase polyprotein 1ab [Bienertia sinuspersici]
MVLFRCICFDVYSDGRGIKKDRFGATRVNTKRFFGTNEPFALASQNDIRDDEHDYKMDVGMHNLVMGEEEEGEILPRYDVPMEIVSDEDIKDDHNVEEDEELDESEQDDDNVQEYNDEEEDVIASLYDLDSSSD